MVSGNGYGAWFPCSISVKLLFVWRLQDSRTAKGFTGQLFNSQKKTEMLPNRFLRSAGECSLVDNRDNGKPEIFFEGDD